MIAEIWQRIVAAVLSDTVMLTLLVVAVAVAVGALFVVLGQAMAVFLYDTRPGRWVLRRLDLDL